MDQPKWINRRDRLIGTVIPLCQMNRWVFILILIPLCIANGCASNDKEDKYETAIKSFALGTPAEETTAAIKLLVSAGVDAFDVLVEHLDDETRASDDHFMRAMIAIDENGNEGPYEPTIGDACFDLLQSQIEGNWAKACRHYYVLHYDNVKEWISSRKGKTLNELRLECAKTSLESARRDQAENPSELTGHCVAILTENLNQIQSKLENAR